MHGRLLWKLLGINVPVLASIVLVLWLAIEHLAADYFTVLMDEYHISPDQAHSMFLSAIHRYLLWAILLALALAGLLSFVLTRKVLRPLAQMMEVTGRLATGDYRARVEVGADDEIGRLGEAFNRMADSLERIEGLRKTMVADAAHELRTPLTNVRGYLEALHDGVIPPTRETFAMLQAEVLRLVQLSDDLLDLARADAAAQDLRREPFSLRDLVEEVLALDRLRLEARGLRVAADLGGGELVADRARIAQAVGNLLDNAIRYSPEGGTVEIAAERLDGGIRLGFANPSAPIPAADLPFLFERFYRADKSRSRDRGGAGVGLAIVKELVEAHGGRVGADYAGGRLRVWIWLPA